MARDRGAAIVETAIVSIFLIWLVLGIVDVGRALFTNISVRDAVQEGASFAAYTDDATAAEIEDRIRNAVSAPDLTTAVIEIYCSEDPRELQDGTRIRIDMTYDLNLITPIVGQMLGGVISLSPRSEADRFFRNCPADVTNPIPAT